MTERLLANSRDPSTFVRRTFRSSRGQGFVEYILLIVIVISLALAVSNAFFKPFNEWARNYIGDYIFCLLDEGELPSLGGADSVSECSEKFEAFTFGGGRPAKSGGDGSGNAESTDDKGSRDRLKKAGAGSDGPSDGGSSNRSRRASNNLGEGFDGGGSGAGKISDVTSQFGGRSTSSRARFGQTSVDAGMSRAAEYNGVSGFIEREQERLKKREDKVSSIGRKSDLASGFVRSNKKLPEPMTVSKKKEDIDLTAGDWSFGEMFRILLILAIIIALLLFVAGQVMQISKSMEKGE